MDLREVSEIPSTSVGEPISPATNRRLIGWIRGELPGPSVLITGGIHGNEPAGVQAARRVHDTLTRHSLPVRGEIVLVESNPPAIAAGKRYLDRDLNRIFQTDIIENAQRRPEEERTSEEEELLGLLAIFESLARRSPNPITVIDLHTTSSPGPPFTIMSDTLANRRLALGLRVPVFLGLEESVPGTLLEYGTERGHVAVTVEGGAHNDPRSAERLEAAVWMGLEAMGSLTREEIPDYARHRETLHQATRSLPRIVELLYRHAVGPEDGFTMKPGYIGFHPVAKGELLAEDHQGGIPAPRSGRLVMPLYQELGSDGFFIVRPVHRGWLTLSAVLRKSGLGRILRHLPGVSSDPGVPGAVWVDRSQARWFAPEIFHLFGYRRRQKTDRGLLFTRRRPVFTRGSSA